MEVGESDGRAELLPGDQWEIQLNGDTVVIGITARDGWRHWVAVPLADFLKYIAAADDSIGEIIDPVKRPAV